MVYLTRAEGILFNGNFANRRKVFFEENLRLRDKTINYVYCIASPATAFSQQIPVNQYKFEDTFVSDGNDVNDCLTQKDERHLRCSYVTFVNGNNEIVHQLSLQTLCDMTKEGVPFVVNNCIDYDKSYIENITGSRLKLYFIFAQGTEEAPNVETYLDSVEIRDFNNRVTLPPSVPSWSATAIRQRQEFPDTESFRDKNLIELTTICDESDINPVSSVATPSNSVLIDKYIMNRCLVTLTDRNNEEIIWNIPLAVLSQNYSQKGALFKFCNLPINWKRSYVTDYSHKYVNSITFNFNVASYFFNLRLTK